MYSIMGFKEIITVNGFGYNCIKSGTSKEFQCKKDFDSYMKRHVKRCGCNVMASSQTNYGNRKPNDFIQIK